MLYSHIPPAKDILLFKVDTPRMTRGSVNDPTGCDIVLVIDISSSIRVGLVPNFEGINIRFLKENTNIPVPIWRYVVIEERIRGEPPRAAWEVRRAPA